MKKTGYTTAMTAAISLCVVVQFIPGFPASAEGLGLRATSPAALAAVNQQVEANLDKWLAFYKTAHAAPELSLQEEKSAARLAARFRQNGFDVTERVGGHGVVAVFKNGDGPTVLIRGDMDALPIVEDTGLPYASKVKVEIGDGSHVGVTRPSWPPPPPRSPT
jgi:hippurate hydrolase